MAAATLLAERGARIALVDEQAVPGGQLYRGVEAASPGLRQILGTDYASGAALVARFRASGASYMPGSAVWQVTPEREVWVSRAGVSICMQAAAIILATGAMERPAPWPGWTLPGVMTAGAVQTLLKSGGIVPALPLVLAGAGPLLLLLAAQCAAAGVPAAAVLDTGPDFGRWAALRYLPAALLPGGVGYLRRGMRLIAALRASPVPVYRQVRNLEIEGDGAVAAVAFRSRGKAHRLPAGIVALHEGVIPAQQMARSIGCLHDWCSNQQAFVPRVDRWGNSSLDGVLIAGDAAGIAGAAAAIHGGRLAAFETLRRLGRIDREQRDRLAAPDRRGQQAHSRVRRLLESLYPPPAAILTPPDEVVICRCEAVTAGALRQVAALNCPGPNQAKSFLRVGMGPCQGRMCGPTVSAILAQANRTPMDAVGYFRVRPPLKPITLGEIATIET